MKGRQRGMMKKLALIALLAGEIILSLWFSHSVRAEFYKYTDKEGKTHYVDDLSKVPDEYHFDVKTYREKYDHLSENEKRIRKEQEQAAEAERRRSYQEYMEQLEIRRRAREQEFAEKKQRMHQTPIEVRGNQILVPVHLGYGTRKVRTKMILDTGASITALHHRIAEQLRISEFKKAKARVADGKIIDTRMARLSFIEVGSNRVENPVAGILDFEGVPDGHDGLLGMDFLRHFNYRLDLQNQVIRWEP